MDQTKFSLHQRVEASTISSSFPPPWTSTSTAVLHPLPPHPLISSATLTPPSTPKTATPPIPCIHGGESISKARSRIHFLLSLLRFSAGDEDPLSSLADTDRPARSLLLSSAALSSPSSGSGDDPLCNWLYDTYLSSDPDLRLVVLSCLPLISAVYLHRIHHPTSDNLISLSGFEAVLLALYSSETKARNGKLITVSIPDLSQPSLYHSPRSPVKSSNTNSTSVKPLVSPLVEPQMAVKSTKRACIVGVALDCYYKQISQMPSWSKLNSLGWAELPLHLRV